jgi:hypothetical protein
MAKMDKHQMNVIARLIEVLFERIKARFLRPNGPKQLRGNWNYNNSLQGIYTQALKNHGLEYKDETYEKLSRIAEGYIDATKEKTKSQVLKNVEDFFVQQRITGGNTDKVLKKELEIVMNNAKDSIGKIISTELNSAKNVGTLEAIDELSASMGEKDPSVAFLGPNDSETCSECKRMYFLSDGTTPKVWRKSELNAGYHKKGNSKPSMLGAHPRCRHSLVLIPQGYGFVNGRIDFINLDHDEWEKQRNQK